MTPPSTGGKGKKLCQGIENALVVKNLDHKDVERIRHMNVLDKSADVLKCSSYRAEKQSELKLRVINRHYMVLISWRFYMYNIYKTSSRVADMAVLNVRSCLCWRRRTLLLLT